MDLGRGPGEHTGSTSWDGYAAACVCDAGVKALTEDGEVAVEMIAPPDVLRLTAPGGRRPDRDGVHAPTGSTHTGPDGQKRSAAR